MNENDDYTPKITIGDLRRNELWNLYLEITINDFIGGRGYKNQYDIDEEEVRTFFEGFETRLVEEEYKDQHIYCGKDKQDMLVEYRNACYF
jgi:hypothetical protein